MNITPRSIKEELARCKAAYLKNEDLRALGCLATALKSFCAVKLGSQDRTEIEGQFREAFSNISKTPNVAKLLPKGLPYLKGQEPKLFQYVAAVFKKVKAEQDRESLDQMRERKLKIDQCILKGQKFLDEGNLLEAQRNFREAVSLRVDEDGLFPMLGTRLMEKGQYKAALEYLRGAIETSPDNPRAYDLLVVAAGKLKDIEAGLKLLGEARKKAGENPLLFCCTAQLLLRAGKLAEAGEFAKKVLAVTPDSAEALKILTKAKAAAM
ncbi:MAG: tetratricopeptide repeat protein [Acidobacteriota bacterium]